jgi:hypothetical protein
MEIIYEFVVGEENVKKIRRKDVFGGTFASTVSLSIFGWLENPHDVIRSRTGKPEKISTFATQVHATAVSVVTAVSDKTGILYNAMQLSNRQVTVFVNGDGIMQDSNRHMLGGV